MNANACTNTFVGFHWLVVSANVLRILFRCYCGVATTTTTTKTAAATHFKEIPQKITQTKINALISIIYINIYRLLICAAAAAAAAVYPTSLWLPKISSGLSRVHWTPFIYPHWCAARCRAVWLCVSPAAYFGYSFLHYYCYWWYVILSFISKCWNEKVYSLFSSPHKN